MLQRPLFCLVNIPPTRYTHTVQQASSYHNSATKTSLLSSEHTSNKIHTHSPASFFLPHQCYKDPFSCLVNIPPTRYTHTVQQASSYHTSATETSLLSSEHTSNKIHTHSPASFFLPHQCYKDPFSCLVNIPPTRYTHTVQQASSYHTSATKTSLLSSEHTSNKIHTHSPASFFLPHQCYKDLSSV